MSDIDKKFKKIVELREKERFINNNKIKSLYYYLVDKEPIDISPVIDIQNYVLSSSSEGSKDSEYENFEVNITEMLL